MSLFRLVLPRMPPFQAVLVSRQTLYSAPALHRATWRSVTSCLQRQTRCYAQAAANNARVQDELRRQARVASKNGKKLELPERLIIYHAGAGRTTFLAMVKITTLFLGAFFCFVVTPGFVKAEKPEWQTAGVALCGIIPILFVAFITSPFVTHIHIHLPEYARASRPILERFVRTLPPTTQLTLTTMSAISKPRYSNLQVGDLVSVRRRFGLVNYVRDTAEENARRRWYMFRAVGNFYLQDQQPPVKVRYQKKVDKVDRWIWDAIKEKVAKEGQTVKSSLV